MLIKADIHIHTCLSPCADITQSPKKVVEKAYKEGINLIFITDHNTIENAEAAIKSGAKYKNLVIYPGMEITSKEEAHTLALMENLYDAYRLQEKIYKYLPDTSNEKEYENQIIANEKDEVEGFLKKSLMSSVNLSIEKIIEIIHENNGIAVAAHIDRESFSIIGQLGFIPDNLHYDALEVSPNLTLDKAESKYPDYYRKYRFLKGSDSHFLESIGETFTEFEGIENSFKIFKNYLHEGFITSYS